MSHLHKFEVTGAGAALDREGHSLYGVIMTANHVDRQNQTISENELQAAAARFLKNPSFKINHVGIPLSGIELAESFVAPATFLLPNGARVQKGQWVCRFAITSDALYRRLAANPPEGFSIGGTANLDKSGGVENILNLCVREISILLDQQPAQRPSRVLQFKSESEEAMFSPECVALMKTLSDKLHELRVSQTLAQIERDTLVTLAFLKAVNGGDDEGGPPKYLYNDNGDGTRSMTDKSWAEYQHDQYRKQVARDKERGYALQSELNRPVAKPKTDSFLQIGSDLFDGKFTPGMQPGD
jgi:hypothetical protein